MQDEVYILEEVFYPSRERGRKLRNVRIRDDSYFYCCHGLMASLK